MGIGVPFPEWVADCSAEHPTVVQLRTAGAVGVVRYLDPGRSDGTEITPAEIADYTANSFPYALVMEYSADWLEGGYNVGHADALAALAEEQKLGIPHGVIYLACDFDVQPAQYAQTLTTMQGFADGYGGRQYVRPYGSKAFCEWVQTQWGQTGCWSTDAWSNFQTAQGSVLHQHASWPAGVPVVPGCDFNDVLGDWAPRNLEADLTPDEHNVLFTTAKAVVQLGGAITGLQNTVNALAQNVIHGDATHYSFDQLKVDVGKLEAALAAAPGGGPVDLQPILDRINALTLKAS